VECLEQSDGTPCAWQLEEKENFALALQRIVVRANAGWHESVGIGHEPRAVGDCGCLFCLEVRCVHSYYHLVPLVCCYCFVGHLSDSVDCSSSS
jgi:hypothetical protein